MWWAGGRREEEQPLLQCVESTGDVKVLHRSWGVELKREPKRVCALAIWVCGGVLGQRMQGRGLVNCASREKTFFASEMRRGVRAGVCTVFKHTYSLRDVAESAASEQNHAQSQCRCVKTQERAERRLKRGKTCAFPSVAFLMTLRF